MCQVHGFFFTDEFYFQMGIVEYFGNLGYLAHNVMYKSLSFAPVVKYMKRSISNFKLFVKKHYQCSLSHEIGQ